MLKSFRYVLFPFSLIYGFIIWIRNRLFDKNILKSASFNFPLICVGNLAVGGTGKTPMTEYLVGILKDKYHTATLSRGYKRKTKGFAIANRNTTALEIGDEPMQIHQKFPEITVAVGEERLVAIPQLLQAKPATQVIILDDAYQHRSIKAGLNILLTEFNNLYTRDFILPVGDLRDIKESSARAHIIIVTKCKPNITLQEKENTIDELKPLPFQKIFFSTIIYQQPNHLFNSSQVEITQDTDILLLAGIANPKPLKAYISSLVNTYDMLSYRDHHIFTSDDLKEIKEHFEKMRSLKKIILTTQKDGVRLLKFEKELSAFPIYVLPVKHEILFGEKDRFETLVEDFVKGVIFNPAY